MPTPTSIESLQVCRQVLTWMAERHPAAALVWMAKSGELDLEPVVQTLGEVEWLTTRTPSRGPLTVHSYRSERETHRFGFPQPVASSPEISPARIRLVLAPGLVFDARGGRLGWGMGYYDRLLARVDRGVPRVGVTLERLMVERVPQESHDIPMTHLITDVGVRTVD